MQLLHVPVCASWPASISAHMKFRYSLSTLALVVTAICLILGRESAIQLSQWQAARQLDKEGALVAWRDDYDSEQWRGNARIMSSRWSKSRMRDELAGPPRVGRWFQRIALVDLRPDWPHTNAFDTDELCAHLGRLQSFPGLRALAIDSTYLPSPASRIPHLPELSNVWIENSPHISSDDFSRISQLSSLRVLAIVNSTVDEDGWDSLCLPCNISDLRVDNCNLTDSVVSRIARIRTLRWLSLRRNSDISNSGVAELANIPSLRFLELGGTGVTYEGALMLASKCSLDHLGLDSTIVPAGADPQHDFAGMHLTLW